MQERINDHEARIKRLEQQTEPINLRIERGLPVPEATLLQKLMEMSGAQATDVGKLKGDMGEVKAIVANLKATQSDHSEMLKDIKATMATKDNLSQLESRIDAKMSAMETRIIDTMTRLMQQKSGE